MKLKTVLRVSWVFMLLLTMTALPSYGLEAAGTPVLNAMYVGSVSVAASGNNGTTTTVTFNGTGLTGVNGVNFYIGAVVDPSITITNIVPNGGTPDSKFKADVVVAIGAATGPRNVTVTTPSGNSTALANGFMVRHATITITAPSSVNPGSNFWISVNVNDAANLNASEFDLNYNSAVIQVIGDENTLGTIDGVTNGRIPSSLGADNYSQVGWTYQPYPGIPGNAIRVLHHMAGVNTVNGSGYLSKINFAALGGAGTGCVLTLTNVGLYNANANNIIPDSIGVAVVSIAGGANKLAFTIQPGGAAAGSPLSPQPVVSIQDSLGVTITNDNTTSVTLSLGGGSPSLLNGTKTVTAVNGIATFNGLSLNQSGLYTLSAASNPVLSGATSNSFAITPGPPNRMAFTTQPGGAIANALLSSQPIIAIKDALGNVAADNTTQVTLTISGNNSAILSGNKTIQAVGGYAAFSGLTVTQPGTYFLTASSSPALTGNVSNSFIISVGSPSKLAFVTQPGGALAGAALTPQPAVAIQDALGNLITGDSSTLVTLAISGNSSATLTGSATAPASNGIASFTGLSINQGGTFSLSATSNPVLSSALSNSINILSDGINLVLLPTNQSVNVGGNFTLILQAQCGLQSTDGIDAYLDYDPGFLEIIGTSPGAALPTVLINSFDNSLGNFNFSAGKLGGALPSGNFTVATVVFRAKQATSSATSVTFHTAIPRKTNVDSAGMVVTGSLTGGNYSINQPGEVIILVKDNAGSLISKPGASFTISPNPYGTGNLTVNDNDSNDQAPANGSIDLKNVPTGNYTLTQIVSPIGYTLDANPQEANVISTTPITLIFTNEQGQINVLKKDSQGNPVGGSTFSITQTVGGNYTATLVDNGAGDSDLALGAIVFKNVPLGTYTVSETIAPPGYFKAADQSGIIVNSPNPVNLSFTDLQPVNLRLLPATQSVPVSSIFPVTVQAQAGLQATESVYVHLDYDPAFLSVQSATAGTAFSTILSGPTYNNTAGTFDFVAIQGSAPFPTGNFTVVTLNLLAKQSTSAPASMIFHDSLPRLTRVIAGGITITGTLTGGSYTLVGTDVNLSVALQGGSRPDSGWVVPLTANFFAPGTASVIGGSPLYSFTQNSTKNGSSAVIQVNNVLPGTYDISVSSPHTLCNLKSIVAISAGSNSIDLGMMLEGDANDDHIINIQDFGLLATAYAKTSGTVGFDARADFDRNGVVNISDFGLLAVNYGKLCFIMVP